MTKMPESFEPDPKLPQGTYMHPFEGRRDVSVTMRRALDLPTPDQLLWVAIRNRTNAISFNRYKRFIDEVICGEFDKLDLGNESGELLKGLRTRAAHHLHGMDAYILLKKATEIFLMHECGVRISHHVSLTEEASRLGHQVEGDLNHELRETYLKQLKVEQGHEQRILPYLELILDKLSDLPLKGDGEFPECYGILRSRRLGPCLLELIWSYWHEEGMLVQTMNLISNRFQNVRGPGKDPLARLDIDPLRSLGHLIWDYIQDEMFRLTVQRRACEYDHQYGLPLLGRAVRPLQSVDSRSKFLEGFHHLLHLCNIFFKEDDNTTVVADGFPVLNALKDVHLLLAEGAHNQFGDMPWTARVEMLMQQWILARPEMREFLGGKIMVPYTEPWMDRVDTVKSMQGWTDVNIMHFRDLGVFGEQLLLSVRYGSWTTVFDPLQAANWARYFRAEIKGYCYAYYAVTGVDLTTDPVNTTLPGVLLRNRLAGQQKFLR
jgi:hypothetical protein